MAQSPFFMHPGKRHKPVAIECFVVLTVPDVLSSPNKFPFFLSHKPPRNIPDPVFRQFREQLVGARPGEGDPQNSWKIIPGVLDARFNGDHLFQGDRKIRDRRASDISRTSRN